MIKLLKKALVLLLTLIAVSFVTFFIFSIAPSDAAQVMLEMTGVPASKEALELKRSELGLDRPLIFQYGDWLESALQGDLGTSFKSGKHVKEELLEAMPNTVILTFSSSVLAILLSIPLGVAGAKNKGRVIDNLTKYISYVLLSLPSFFVSLVFLYVFALKLKWFNVIGGEDIKDAMLPTVVLGITTAAWLIRQIRAAVLAEYKKDYVLACRSRGIDETTILYRHVLKNAMLPIITLIGLSFGGILGGTLIVENIFNWSGLGQLAMKSITYRDYPIIMGYVLFMSISLLLINLLVDISYILLDPRTKKKRVMQSEQNK